MKFTNLKIWEKSHQLALEIYNITSKLPNHEKYGIISQIQRSSTSIPANIVEGFGRKGNKEFLQFLYQAKGSLTETQYFLILIKDLRFIDQIEFEKIINSYEELAKMLNSFINQLKLK